MKTSNKPAACGGGKLPASQNDNKPASHNYKLSGSHIRYLITMHRLKNADNTVRCVDIAQSLGISKPSVHSMIKLLRDMELVQKENYGVVYLTEKGVATAERYSRGYDLKLDCLNEVLPDENSISSSVCMLLSSLSEEKLSLL